MKMYQCLRVPLHFYSIYFSESSVPSFNQKFYYRQVPYAEVQEATDLISVGFDEGLTSQPITRAAIVDDGSYFKINKTSLVVSNTVPLKSGRYDFLIVVLHGISVQTAPGVVDVLSKRKNWMGACKGCRV